MLDAQARFMQFLEKAGRLNRGIEFLPSDEVLAEPGAGARADEPEHAVLLAHSKDLAPIDELLCVVAARRPVVATALVRYFPQVLQQRFAERRAIRSSARSSRRTSPTA